MWPLSADRKTVGQVGKTMEQDRSLHAVCKLNTALRLITGKDVHVPRRAFPAFMPSRLARGLQMINSALNLPYSIAPECAIVSGRSLAYMTGELEYSRDRVARRAIHCLSIKQPFFIVSGDPAVSLSSQTGCDPDLLPTLHFCSQCVVIVKAKYQGIPAVFRVGRCEEARAEVFRQKDGIKLAGAVHGLQDVVPRLLEHSITAAGMEVSVETLLPGSNVQFSWKRIDAILELWLASDQTSRSPARPFLGEELAQVCEAFPAYQSSLSSFKDSLLDWHSSLVMPGSLAHGDFWLGNILFSGDSITGIIDWEWAHPDGLRLIDALQLLFMSYSAFRNIGIAETLRAFWLGAVEDHELKVRLAELCHTLGLHENDLKFAALILWFDYLRERLKRGRMPSVEWTEDMIPRTIPSIRHWLDQFRGGTSEATS
jgi:hypothetical protein